MSQRRLSRRAFIGGGMAAATAAWTATLWTPARARALRQSLATAANPAGTTLESTIQRATATGWSRLIEGPGWPTVVRAELAAAAPGRDQRRVPLATVAHLTDVHIIDAQSPGRVEFVDPFGDPYTAAFRPHETLTCHVQSAMVTRLNQVGSGPITGRPIDCAVSTGDNIDNCQTNELAWFMAVLDGGLIAPNSGAPGVYEGVQSAAWGDPRYWHPDAGVSDSYKTANGFPDMPGLLTAAVAPYTTPALTFPWYSTYGNHDGLVQGNLPRTDTVDAILTGDRKITDLKPGQSALEFVIAMFNDIGGVQTDLANGTYPQQAVTPDASRRTVRTTEWVQAHLDAPAVPGPKGHGYTDAHLALPALYYSFEIAPGVLGVSLDTGGFNSGSIGQTQLDWLEQTLRSAHSAYFDDAGNPVRTGNTDQLVLVFSHFNMRSMTGSLTDPANPTERRILGPELTSVLLRYPNVIAWVNGHHHVNEIQPVPDPSGRAHGFWDINTCSHVDWPQLSRLIELVDNRDGTLSIFCTLVEHAGPAAVDYGDTSPLGLASLNRELAANDPQSPLATRLGRPEDGNTELVLPVPFGLAGVGQTTTTTTAAPVTTAPASASVAVPVGARPAFTG